MNDDIAGYPTNHELTRQVGTTRKQTNSRIRSGDRTKIYTITKAYATWQQRVICDTSPMSKCYD